MNAPALSREQLRSRRKREVRAVTVSTKRATKAERARWRRENPVPDDHPRIPATRGECQWGFRPCPFVSCRWHLYLDVSPRTGSIKMNFPDLEVWEMPPGASCALDVADRGGTTLEDLGAIMNLTRERIRQVEAISLTKIEALHDAGLLEHVERGPVGRRSLPVLEDEVDDEPGEETDGEELDTDWDAAEGWG